MKFSKITLENFNCLEDGKPTDIVILIHRIDDSPLPRCQELFNSEKINGNTNFKTNRRKKMLFKFKESCLFLKFEPHIKFYPHCLRFIKRKENHKPTPLFITLHFRHHHLFDWMFLYEYRIKQRLFCPV